jgi:hypothetical protein
LNHLSWHIIWLELTCHLKAILTASIRLLTISKHTLTRQHTHTLCKTPCKPKSHAQSICSITSQIQLPFGQTISTLFVIGQHASCDAGYGSTPHLAKTTPSIALADCTCSKSSTNHARPASAGFFVPNSDGFRTICGHSLLTCGHSLLTFPGSGSGSGCACSIRLSSCSSMTAPTGFPESFRPRFASPALGNGFPR